MPAPLKIDDLFTPSPLQPQQGQQAPSAVPRPAPAAPTSPPPQAGAPAGRGFADAGETRRLIYDNVLSAARNIKPVSNTRYRMELHDVDYEDPDHISIADQKQAVLTGQTLSRRLRGTWRMFDQATNDPVDEKRVTLANVPHMTHRGTFVLGGTEYTLAHQMRLRAGMYHRVKENGEIEAHANIMPGKGLSHRYFLEPETGVFKVNLGQANLPLVPLLRAMGVTDKEMRQSWGNELYAANNVKDDTQVIDKLYTKLLGRKAEPRSSHQDKAKAVATALVAMELDPEVTKRTLGGPHTHLTKEAILATTKKLLAIGRGEQEADDRDHLAFQHFMGPEDLMSERFNRTGTALQQALWRSTHKGNLQSLPAGMLTKHVHGAILDSGLGQPLEEINPADVFDQQTRVTRLGYGGIPSIDSVPDEARAVQPSHTGYIDLIRAPESAKVGVDSRVAWTTRKGPKGQILSPLINPKTGQQEYKSPQDIADLTVAFPGPEWENGEPLVPAQVKGKTRYVPRDKVDMVHPHAENWFSPLNNMVPNKATIKGQRASMASRFIAQALPLAKAESPLVRSAVPGTNGERSFEEEYGKHMGAVHAKDIGGRVTAVDNQFVTVKYADGTTEKHEIYDHFPYNRKTYLHNTPLVKPGDPVKPGQLLAKSNYTDDQGHVALGLNARVAYLPFRGLNYEDAFVISESFAKRLSSEHMYQHQMEWDDKHRQGKNAYVSIFPATYDKKMLDNMDDDGVIKPGTVVKHNQPLVLAARERDLSHKQVHSAHKGSFQDQSLTWEHHADGIVTDVAKTGKGVVVAVKSLADMQMGDKMSGRYGDKGVVSSIVPDHEMPVDDKGKPFEVLANPTGVISRTNPGQIAEAVLGKIAAKTGKPYLMEDFNHRIDVNDHVEQELAKHGLSSTETVVDPTTGRKIPGVLTGMRFYMKLHHTSESKGQGRGLGGYTAEDTPARGGTEGSKRLALMDVNALLSHGATEVLRDAKLVRGQKNQEYWANYMAGFKPPTPNIPYTHRKFIEQLKGSGINVVRQGSEQHIMPMTEKQIDQLAESRELQNVETVDWKTGLQPKRGGLFDQTLTGGHGGNRWSFIKLHEPMPNPVMEEGIRRLLGMTGDQFEAVLSGKEPLRGTSGPQAIQKALQSIDVDQMTAQCLADVRGGKKTARDAAIRKLHFLQGAKKQGIHPSEWMLNKVPVLPPSFRPVSVMQKTGNQLISDANYLYKELWDSNQVLKDSAGKVDDVSEERLNVYNSFKAVTGLGDPVQPKNKERQVKGLLQQIFGSSPKFGTVQQKLLGTPVDLVGRAVVVPNPDLTMDEVGLPENRAWSVYSPFIVRRLVRHGVGRVEAIKAVKDRSDLARKSLVEEMDERPVLVNRAPVLHKYGLMAFHPKLVKGDVMHISPVVVGGFAMDFDGDASNYHVPATDEARDEAMAKMLPSKNLLSASQFKVHYLPRQEYVGGLYSATRKANDKRPRTFRNEHDVLQAVRRGELDMDHPIDVLEHG